MATTFETKAGKLRYNVVELFHAGKEKKRYVSSLGYASSLRAAKELATRRSGRHTQVRTPDGEVKFEQLPTHETAGSQ